ncbi:hypothetical protein BV898_08785 [Hypsibius exemplaris]|uniref:Receptor ligand binding region domain-containing protein n=1 Tax=Hypsibius exemplaris TaxID=2072580 RepID=A0A1W0WPD2_HYPEX|nr:hypothetical protein BV898_08785 [Hypsibius exemplaris]
MSGIPIPTAAAEKHNSKSTVEVALLVFGRTSQTRSIASLSYSEPPMKIAADTVTGLYNGTLRFTYVLTTAHNCITTANAPDEILADWYYRFWAPGRVLILITPGDPLGDCWTDSQSLYRLAASWNTLIINTAGGVELAGKRSILPTTLSLSVANMPSYGAVALNLIQRHNWTSVFIVWDSNSTAPNKATSIFLATALQKGQIGRVAVVVRQVDSAKSIAYKNILTEFRQVSRVFFYFGWPIDLRQFLITAYSLNMTNGEYVYLALQLLNIPSLYGNLTWRVGDEHDEVAQSAFRSLLVIEPLSAIIQNSPSAGDNYTQQLGLQFQRGSAQRHNLTYASAVDFLPILLGAYNSILIVGQVLLEAWQCGFDLTDGKYLAGRFLNRSFSTQAGTMFVNQDGIRMETLVVSHTMPNSELRKPFFELFGKSQTSLTQLRVIDWPNLEWPPPNEPRCGFRNEEIFCSASSTVTNWLILGIAILVLCGFTGFWFVLRMLKREDWWLINELQDRRNRTFDYAH